MRLFLLPILLLPGLAFADILTSALYETATSTDEFNSQTVKLGVHSGRTNPFWVYPEEEEKFFWVGGEAFIQDGDLISDEYKYRRVNANFGYKHSPSWQFQSSLGKSFLNFNDKDDSNIYASVGGAYSGSEFYLDTRLNHRPLLEKWLMPGAVINSVQETDLETRVLWIQHPRWRLSGFSDLSWSDDGNLRQNYDLAQMYGVMPGEPWLWIGLGGNYLTARQNEKYNYWSPREFYALGPRLDLSFAITDKVRFAAATNLNLISEDDSKYFKGHYTTLGFDFGSREATLLNLRYVINETQRDNVIWRYNAFSLNLSHLF